MGFRVKAVNSCTIVSVNGSSFSGASTANVIFKNLETGSVYSQVLNYSGGNQTGQTNVLVSNLPSANGVYEVSLEEGGVEVARRPLILHCDIDCCISKLTNELIDCACDCPKCASALAKAQKVFLLLQSALSSVDLASTHLGSMNSGYYQDVLEKYKKAKAICDESCGCNC
jgi:hypothetical protein